MFIEFRLLGRELFSVELRIPEREELYVSTQADTEISEPYGFGMDTND